MAKQRKAGDTAPEGQSPLAEGIRALAYQLYCESGYQNGHDLEHWLEAERQTLNRRKPALRKVV
jgi:hypothetical protein